MTVSWLFLQAPFPSVSVAGCSLCPPRSLCLTTSGLQEGHPARGKGSSSPAVFTWGRTEPVSLGGSSPPWAGKEVKPIPSTEHPNAFMCLKASLRSSVQSPLWAFKLSPDFHPHHHHNHWFCSNLIPSGNSQAIKLHFSSIEKMCWK